MDRADLDQSFRELDGWQHFLAETMRGRLRSLAVRLQDARGHFQRALQLAAEAPGTIRNRLRTLVLHVYWFESTLLERPLVSSAPPPQFEVPQFSREDHDAYPEIQFGINLRACAEGLWRLHAGEWTISTRIYRDLIEAGRNSPGPILGGYYLGLAASQRNLGQVEDARKSLETAGLHVALEGTTLNRLSVAASLHGAYLCFEDEESAEAWRLFLERLNCPRATKDAFLRRASILVERWRSHSQMLIFG